MFCGLDELLGGHFSNLRRRLRSERIGVLTHAAAIDRKGRQCLLVLEELGTEPTLVFTPEHGLQATAQAEEPVLIEDAGPGAEPSEGTGVEGPRFVSLYGSTKASLTPQGTDLEDIDVLVIDLADVGARYYTYVWSALLAARAAAAAGKHTLVLDRPNPLSGDPTTLEGTPQGEDFRSFVGLESVPTRHAMTIGELVAHFMAADGHPLGPDGAVSVLPTNGWERHRTAEAWGRPFVLPSPNMPTLETALVYPGACLVEGTNLSEGRGTTVPFQMIGAPFLDGPRLASALLEHGLPGAMVRPVTFRPTFEKHAGEECHGVMIHITNPSLFKPVTTYLTLLTLARAQAPESFEFLTRAYEFETDRLAFDLLTGGTAVREAMTDGAAPDEVVNLGVPVPPEWAETVVAAEARLRDALA